MKDDADIRFVNTHSESIGGYHYADFPVLPAFLAEVFHCIIQSGMIEFSAKSLFLIMIFTMRMIAVPIRVFQSY